MDMLYRHPKRNLVSCFMAVAILSSLSVNSSEEVEWITIPSTIHTCKGQTAHLHWDFIVKGKEIRTLEWYFNDSTLICVLSDKGEFKVKPPYQDRIERFEKSGIRLKNITPDDEGTFTLLPVLFWSTSESMQRISLQVSEPPTDMCMIKITRLGSTSKLRCDVSSSGCGRPKMSIIWKKSKTFDVLGEGGFIEINSSFYDTEILCCLEGKAMECVDKSFQRLCETFTLNSNKCPSETSKNMLEKDASEPQVPHSCDTDWSKLHDPYGLSISVISVIVSFVAATLSFLIFKQMKILVVETQEMRKDKDANHTFMEMYEMHKNKELRQDAVEMQEMRNKKEVSPRDDIVPLLDRKEGACSTPIKLSDPIHETETITQHEPSTNSKTGQEIQELRHAAHCKICYTNKMTMLLMPCKHIATCADCSTHLQQCPICRSSIKEKMNIRFD